MYNRVFITINDIYLCESTDNANAIFIICPRAALVPLLIVTLVHRAWRSRQN